MNYNEQFYKRIKKKEFIKMIDELFDDDAEFNVQTLDFDAGQKISVVEHVNKDGINHMAKDSKCIIFSGSRYMSYVDLHSVNQPDIYNIQKRGVKKTILLDGV